MKLNKSAKPISYLKRHIAKALRDVSEGQRTMVITQHEGGQTSVHGVF